MKDADENIKNNQQMIISAEETSYHIPALLAETIEGLDKIGRAHV